MKNHAFTLIELLVVVLIIGILAAVALPQYRASVGKARAVEIILALNALEKAQAVYKMTNGAYATNLNDLDIEIPRYVTDNVLDTYAQIKVPNSSIHLQWIWNPREHRCISTGARGKNLCKSLGGVEMEHAGNTENIQYYKLLQY